MATFTESDILVEALTIRPVESGFEVVLLLSTKDVSGSSIRSGLELNLTDKLTAQQVTTLTNFMNDLIGKAKAKLVIS